MENKWAARPYILWVLIFTLIPLFLILYYSFTIKTPEGMAFSLENYKRFFDPLYIDVLWRSIQLAFTSTVICLVFAYPLAMILAGKEMSSKSIILLLVILPMWMNSLLRTYAWMTLLENNGIINTFLTSIGLSKLQLIYTDQAVVFGMVYNFFPFMVLPIYNVLTKIDKSIVEAAQDLGANSRYVFRKVTLPLSIPGVVSGIVMVFMPSLTTFVISSLLGGGQYTLIGNMIEQQFRTVNDWGFGSALSVILMAIILLSIGIMSRYDSMEQGGGIL